MESRAQLIALLNQKILSGGRRTTAQFVRDWGAEIIDSTFNLVDGAPTVKTDEIMGMSGSLFFRQTAQTSGALGAFRFITPANTNQTAGADCIAFSIGMSNIEHANGSITLNRDVVIGARTHNFVGPGTSTIATAGTLVIAGAPIAGSNAAITNPYSFLVESGNSFFNGAVFVDNGTSNIKLGLLDGTSSLPAIYFNQSVPSPTNYNITGDASDVLINNAVSVQLRVANTSILRAYSAGITINGNIGVGASGGMIIALAPSEKITFWGATPIARPTNVFAGATLNSLGGTPLESGDTYTAPSAATFTQAQLNNILMTLLNL